VSKVGIVVIGRNEGPRLEQCLRSVLTMSDQLVYADSASTDGSPETAERLGITVVRLPEDGRLNAARGRNAAYKELRARFPECDLIQFLDGDCILQPEWLPRAVEFLESHPDVAVVCGRRFEAHPEESIYNALCDQEWNTPVGEARECGGDALIRRSAFDQIGGYNPNLQAGEEPEMTARMRAAGRKIWRIDARMTEHDAKILSFGQWWRRTQRGGFGYAQVWSATKGLPQRLYGRQLRSALAWAIALPLLVILAVALTGRPLMLLLIPAAYGFQLLRIARGCRGEARFTKAALILLAKIPEAVGAVRFFVAGGGRRVPEYKS
jgi:glycosyltransferase involved in cell wall biosynthesis